ncbi:MAG: hypothetical protein ACK2TX_12835, partial [Anaerolineales bacterium]
NYYLSQEWANGNRAERIIDMVSATSAHTPDTFAEIQGDNQRARIIQPPDRGIIRHGKPDQQVRIGLAGKDFFKWAQDLRQRLRAELGSSTCAGGQAGQLDLLPRRSLHVSVHAIRLSIHLHLKRMYPCEGF